MLETSFSKELIKEFSKEITKTIKTKDITFLKKFLFTYKEHLSLFRILKEIEFICTFFPNSSKNYDLIVLENILNCLIDFAVENIEKKHFLSSFSSIENVIDSIDYHFFKKNGKILFYKGVLKYLIQKYFLFQVFLTEKQKNFISTFIYKFFTDIFHYALFTKDPFYNQLIQSKELITLLYKKTELYYALKDIFSLEQFRCFFSFIRRHPNEKLYRTILNCLSSISQKDYDFIVIDSIISIGTTSLGVSLLLEYFQKKKLFICNEIYKRLYECINSLKDRQNFLSNKDKKTLSNFITLFENLVTMDEEKEERRFFDGNNLLHLAVMLDLKEVVLKLLNDKFDVNSKNHRLGNTPLFYANSEEMVDILLKYGADAKIKNFNGMTALEFMEKRRINTEIRRKLAQYIITPIIFKNIKKDKKLQTP